MSGFEGPDWERFQRSVGFVFEEATPDGVRRELADVLHDYRAVEVAKGPAGPELVRRVRDFSGAVVLVGPDTLAFGFDGGSALPAGAAYLPENEQGLAVAFLTSAAAQNPSLTPEQVTFTPGRKETVPVPLRFHVTDPRGMRIGPASDDRGAVAVKDADGRLQMTVLFAEDVEVSVDGQVPTGRPVRGEARRVSATVEGSKKFLNVLSGTGFWSLSIRLADGSVVEACAPDRRVPRVSHPAARLRPENPYPVGTTVSGDALLVGRFLADDPQPIVLADPLWVVGGRPAEVSPAVEHGEHGSVIRTDVATSLGLRFAGGAAVWEVMSTAPRTAGWATTEHLDTAEKDGVLFPVGTRVTVGRQGYDGAGVARSLPSGDWLAYLDRAAVPADRLQLAVVDCVVVRDAATLHRLWGIDKAGEQAYSERSLGPHLMYGASVPVCCEVDEVRSVAVELMDGIGGSTRYEAFSRIGDHPVTLHLPRDVGELQTGTIICGFASMCATDTDGIGDLVMEQVPAPELSDRAAGRPDAGDSLLLRVIDDPPDASALSHLTARSVPSSQARLRSAAARRNLEAYVGDDLRWRVRPTAYGTPQLPVDREILTTLHDVLLSTAPSPSVSRALRLLGTVTSRSR